jgi:hypothetical protein
MLLYLIVLAFVLVVAIYLLFLAIDYGVGLLPPSKEANDHPPFPFARALKFLVLVGAVVVLFEAAFEGHRFIPGLG